MKRKRIKNGGIIKDNLGYWNPDNWGKPVQIDGNNITMRGVNQPLMGISDTMDTKLMLPGEDYIFNGNSVVEVPLTRLNKETMKKKKGQKGIKLNDEYLNKYPRLQSVYGEGLKDITIKADTNFKPSEIGYGDIEFFDEMQDSVRYSDDPKYRYANPGEKYGILYNPKKEIDDQSIFLDMLHGMKKDAGYKKLRDAFKQETLKGRSEDIKFFYNKDKEAGFATDGYDQWLDNYVDGLVRSEFFEGKDGDYTIEREGNTPQMKLRAKIMKEYMKTNPYKKQKGGKVKKAQMGTELFNKLISPQTPTDAFDESVEMNQILAPKIPSSPPFGSYSPIQKQGVPNNQVLAPITPMPTFGEEGSNTFMGAGSPITRLTPKQSPLISSQAIAENRMEGQVAKPKQNTDATSSLLAGVPVLGGLIDGFTKLGEQKNAMKREKAATSLASLNAQAAASKPKEEMRKYVRPEDMVVSGDELFPVNGVGTDILAKDGTRIPKAFLGSLLGGSGGGGIGGMLGGLLGGNKQVTSSVNQEAGSAFGGAAADALNFIPGIGPAVSGIAKPIFQAIGGMIDPFQENIDKEKGKQQTSAMQAAGVDFAKGFQRQNSAFMKHGGKMAFGGDLQVYDGNVEPLSVNPYSSGTVQFNGPSHDDGGILTSYGNNSVEVEGGETASVDGNGMTVFGNLPISKQFANLIGDERASGKKFKSYGKLIAEDERKANNIQTRSMKLLDDTDERTPFGKLTLSSIQANDIGAKMRLKDAAAKKQKASDLQTFINELADNGGFDADALARGEVKKAKNGGKIQKAQKGFWTESRPDKDYVPVSENNVTDYIINSQAVENSPWAGSGPYSGGNNVIYQSSTGQPTPEYTPVENTSGSTQTTSSPTRGSDNYETRGMGKRPAVVGSLDFGDLPKVSQEDYDYLSKLYDAAKKQGKGKDVETFQKEYHRIAGPYAQKIIDAYDMTNYGKKRGMKEKGLETNVDSLFGERTEQYMQALGKRPENIIPPEKKVIPPPENIVPPNPLTPEGETPPQEKPRTKIPWQFLADTLSPYMRKSYREGLDWKQLAGEMAALRDHEEPVYAQLYTPELDTPYDISFQDRINENTATTRALSRGMGYNPAAAATLASQNYAANSNVLAEQFRANQAKKDQVYSKNRDILNNAELINLGILDKQQERQATAKSNTKTNRINALSSMASKYMQNNLENRQLATLENLYQNYGFDRNMRARSQGLTLFEPGVVGSTPPEETQSKKEKRNGGIVKAIKGL